MAGRLKKLFHFRRTMRLGEFPYTYVRVSVMRSALYKKSEYDKLLKMSFGEISRFMQDSAYSEDVSAFGMSYSGLELIERATYRNLVRTFAKLRRISSPELQLLIGLYLGRFDNYNIKTILRGIYSGKPKEQMMEALIFAGALDEEKLRGMLDAGTIPEAIALLPKMEKSQREALANAFTERGNLIEVENILDKLYFTQVFDSLGKFSGQGKLFREFMLEEIGILNLMTFLKLRKKGLANKDIKGMLVDIESGSKTSVLLKHLLSSHSDEGVIDLLQQSEYSKFLAPEAQKGNPIANISLTSLEEHLHAYLLRKSMLLQHQNPLSVDVILGYMFAKEMEVRNLRLIAKAKGMGLPEERIAAHLVM